LSSPDWLQWLFCAAPVADLPQALRMLRRGIRAKTLIVSGYEPET